MPYGPATDLQEHHLSHQTTNNKRAVGGVVAVGTIILGVVGDLDEVVDTRVEEGTTARITSCSRVACTFQMTNIEPLLQTNSGSGETFAAKYKVNRPRPRVVRSAMKETVVAGQMLHHRTWTVPRSHSVRIRSQ